ncbi:SDR family NAD(P)-dependent oxidoreductase [Rhodoferax sp.]|uniref:SDR family NAD(P)-dependent oxidoreductase n=1 Tax=Rhodoferax sp. TaxID=50421 RepID=UPI0025DECB1D|nr:SDR family NAD(P)-dependent oxidoreductase [Rhodoferax sp.]
MHESAPLQSFPSGGMAVVIGAGGGIGAALVQALEATGGLEAVVGLSRHTKPALDLLDEDSICTCAQQVQARQLPVRLVLDATGFLHNDIWSPEKSWQQLDPAHMAHSFAVNAIGPALLMKHFLPLLPRDGKSVFATLSAKVGSIGDNRLGGWYSYRAAKAALNQLVHTAAIELKRRHPQAMCIAMHPGTVDTGLSTPFAKTGLEVRTPAAAAERLLAVINALQAEHSGGFINHDGTELPW